jgi:DNA-binding CsgD family transcriptional regulator
MDERVRRLVLSRPIPERLIASLAAAPDIPPHEIEIWVRAGGRITNNGPRSRTAARYRGAHVTHPPSRLSRRELQAIRLLASGLTHKEAAYAMGVTARTLEGLLATARYRLGRSKTSEQAVLVAAARGLVEFPAEDRVRLTPQQSQALAMFWEGARQVEIARAMGIEQSTVSGYLKAARRRLGAATTAEAARLAFG